MNMNAEHKKADSLTIDDLLQLKGISDPCLSPDGKQVLCVITEAEVTGNGWLSSIALISIHDQKLIVVTEGSSPRWSPKGSAFAFQNDVGELWIYDLEKREASYLVQVYESSYFMGHLVEKCFAWSPDGRYIAYVSADPSSISSEGDKKDSLAFNRLLYKSKGGRGRSFYADDCLTHIWLIPASGGVAENLTPGDYNEHSISWSPDGRQLAFISNRSLDPDNNQRFNLWSVDVDTKEVTRLTDDVGTAYQPVWSPDGKSIAYLATTSERSTNDSLWEDTQLYLYSFPNGSSQCLSTKLDRRVGNVSWHLEGEFIYFVAEQEGCTPVCRISIKTNEIEVVIDGEFRITDYALSQVGNEIVYVGTDTKHPQELFLASKNEKEPLQLTQLNATFVGENVLQESSCFWYKSFDQTLVQGWLLKPANFDPHRTYPMILVIHGGPHNMFGYEFDEKTQLLSAQGFGVLYINPRGSSGYGQSFSKGCVSDWGGGDYKDLMAGVDHAIEHNEWIDKERLGVTGQSYGGYMTNWMITQSNRFKAAVVDGGLSNLISFSGTSLYSSLIESEFGGNAFDNFSLLWRCSPIRDVRNVNTPTLFLHGELDNEVPLSQAEEMYVALKKLNVKTSLVIYRGEGHGWRPDLKPQNKCDVYDRMINWFVQLL